MKLNQLLESQEPSEFASVTKVIKALGLTAALKNRTKHMYEDGVRATTLAIRNGVKAGYWNYVSQGAGAAKLGGDLQTLSWALSSMERTNASEMSFIKEISKEVTSLFTKMDDINGLLKAMEATQLCLSEIAKAVKDTDREQLERTMARTVLKKLGVAEYFGVKDEA